MKKTLLLMISCILLIFIIFGITACGNKSGNTNYSSEYQKVKVAFDGVEASFSSSSNAKSRNAYDVAYAEDKAEAALQTIRSQYTEGDKQTGTFDELDYDEPPMRQFQYLKAIFEEMGGDYKLGTKYYYNITGDIYLDIETGYKVDKTKADANNYKYAYVFGFAMNIELRENNLIFAEVGFSISLTQGQKNYKTSWYVSFDLDYDFDENTPTYTLHMYTDNKESELKYLHRDQGYEYDYVCMEKGAIKEWRKFEMDCDKEIVISESHPSFDSYVADGLEYEVGTCKWLKNGDYYKIMRITEEKKAIIAKAFADGLGLNSTSINSAPFVAKEGEVNKVIDTYYKKICELFGDDIIYDLVCKNSDDDSSGKHQSGTWESIVPSYLSYDVPAFSSSTAIFSVQSDNNGQIVVTVRNPGTNDYSTYEAKLLEEGFMRNDEAVSAAVAAYMKVDGNGNAVIIVIDEVNNKIYIENVDSSGSNNENNGNNEKTYPIDNGIDFVGEYLAVAMNDVFAKDISGVIEELSDGNIKASNLNSFISGKLYTFTLANDNKAKDTATRYGGKYMDSGEWTNRYTNSVNYKEGRSQDVLILIASSNSNNEAYLCVYVLLFNGGTVKNIVDNDVNGNGGNGGNQGQIGEDGSGTSGQNQGEGEDFGGNGQGQQGGSEERRLITINVYVLDSAKNIENEEPYEFYEGDVIELAQFKNESQNVYTDKACNDKNMINSDTIEVYEGLSLYIWEPVEEEKMGTFTIYDINGKEKSLYTQFETEVGDGVYFGYSFEYLLYWDEGCSQQVDLYHNFNMTEEGITVYRKIYEDFFVVNIKCYINDHLWGDGGFTNSNGIYRKGKVYYLYTNSSIIDFGMYRSWIGQDAEFYLGEGKDKDNIINEYCYLATDANEITISVYAQNNNYKRYTLKTESGTTLTEDYIVLEGFDEFYYNYNTFEYKQYYCDNCTVSGNTITMHGVHTYPYSLTVYNVWNGRVLNENSGYVNTYFKDGEDNLFKFNGDPGPSSEFFKDVNCSEPIILEDTGEGYGEYVLKSSTILYTPYNP